MDLKYEKEFGSIEGCPPANAEPCERLAYRFTYEEIDDSRNFLPVALLNPRRRFDDDFAGCIAYALSMFSAKDFASGRYRELRKKHKQIHKTIGTHLAEGKLTKEDGLAIPPNKTGHFSFFEAADCELSKSFDIIEVLYHD